MTESTISFNENFTVLKGVADALRNQQEPDIDSLVPMVDKAMTAYKNCNARIEQVSAMLNERLTSQPASNE